MMLDKYHGIVTNDKVSKKQSILQMIKNKKGQFICLIK